MRGILMTRDGRSVHSVRPGELRICGSCRMLKGPVPDRVDGAGQRCECAPSENGRAEPLWGGDFNTYAELCRCCGLVLLCSGSRWCVWFCEPCKRSVVALNRAAGRCLIPIGRHSLMNGVAARSEQLGTEVGVVAFADQLDTFIASIDGPCVWAATVTASNTIALGFGGDVDVRLADYLAAVPGSTLSSEAAFTSLVATARVQGRRLGMR